MGRSIATNHTYYSASIKRSSRTSLISFFDGSDMMNDDGCLSELWIWNKTTQWTRWIRVALNRCLRYTINIFEISAICWKELLMGYKKVANTLFSFADEIVTIQTSSKTYRFLLSLLIFKFLFLFFWGMLYNISKRKG